MIKFYKNMSEYSGVLVRLAETLHDPKLKRCIITSPVFDYHQFCLDKVQIPVAMRFYDLTAAKTAKFLFQT